MYIVAIQNDGVSVKIHDEVEKLLSGSVVKGINTIDSFTFSILPSNVGFALLNDMKTLVSVYNTNKSRYEFYGRVLYTSAEMTESGLISKSVTCESLFGYLCDSQQEYVEERNWTVNGLFGHIVSKHNELLEEAKHFKVGKVEVTDPNNNLYCGIQRKNTWETIKEKLLNVLGGEIRFRVVGEDIYIDYLNQIGETKTTEITLTRNMKAITRERNPCDLITRLIPLGAKTGSKVKDAEGNETESEERYDISSVNDGKKYLDDANGIVKYGIHVGYVEWDDVTDPTNLLNNGKKWLADNVKVPVKYSITALDLSLLGLDIDDFDIGNTHPIKNPLIGIDDTARIVKKTINISDETKGSIEVGDKFKTMTEIQQDQKREADAAVKAVENLKKANGNYVGKNDKDYVVSMVNDATEKLNLEGNRLSYSNDNSSMDSYGNIIAQNVNIKGRFESEGTQDMPNADGGTDEVPVSVVIDKGTVAIDGPSCHWDVSGIGQFGIGADYGILDGKLVYHLLPWGIEFGSIADDGLGDESGYQAVGGISSTPSQYGTMGEGNPSQVTGHMELYGDWKVVNTMYYMSGETIASDENKKNTITELESQAKYSALFDKLKPCIFKYNDGTSDRFHVGFIAQQVKDSMDAAGVDTKDFAALCIRKNRDGTEDWSLRYSEFIAMNTLEIQKLKARVEKLEKLLEPTEEI